MTDRYATRALTDVADESADQRLEQLLAAPMAAPRSVSQLRIEGVRIGTLVGFMDNGAVPLVTYPDQPVTAAQAARATLDLHAAHIGRRAVLMFEEGDPHKPIVIGCLHEGSRSELPSAPDNVHVEADGERVVVSARNQIVLRCGKASITLTKEGKVLVQGAYVSSQSSGVLRIRGGSVQIN